MTRMLPQSHRPAYRRPRFKPLTAGDALRRIAVGVVGGTEETDGIELAGSSFGDLFPDGLFIAQDGHNQPAAQNFKLVSWAAVKAALGID